MAERSYLVYAIQSSCGKKTYVGCTNNFARRIRQHNGELVGGARYTRGSKWCPILHVAGLKKREALQLEWAMKHKRCPGVSGAQGRIKTMQRLMKCERWTQSATPLKKIIKHINIKLF